MRNLLILAFLILIVGCGQKNIMSIDNPQYSENGKSVTFSAACHDDKGTEGIYVVGLADNKMQVIYESNDRTIMFSDYVSKEEIIYSSSDKFGSCSDICMINLQDKERNCISNNGYGGSFARFSSTEEKVYFSSFCVEGDKTRLERMEKGLYPQYDIYSIDLDGTNRARLTNLNSYFISDLSISEEKGLIVFNREDYQLKPSSIWIYDIKEHSVRPFAPNLMPYVQYVAENKGLDPKELLDESLTQIYDMTILPDGNTIAFPWREPYTNGYDENIYLANLETKKVDKIEIKAGIQDLNFSENGEKILFVENNTSGYMHIWEIRRDGTGRKKIFDGKKLCH